MNGNRKTASDTGWGRCFEKSLNTSILKKSVRYRMAKILGKKLKWKYVNTVVCLRL